MNPPPSPRVKGVKDNAWLKKGKKGEEGGGSRPCEGGREGEGRAI